MSQQAGMLSRWLRGLRMVGSAMLGVRARQSHEADAKALSPLLLVIVAVVLMACLVGALITLASHIAQG